MNHVDMANLTLPGFHVGSEELTVNGVAFVRKDSIPAPTPPGNRVVMVIKGGWIYAGDCERKDGRIILRRPVMLMRADGIGLEKAIVDWRSDKVHLKSEPDGAVLDIPCSEESFCRPVEDDWGIR